MWIVPYLCEIVKLYVDTLMPSMYPDHLESTVPLKFIYILREIDFFKYSCRTHSPQPPYILHNDINRYKSSCSFL